MLLGKVRSNLVKSKKLGKRARPKVCFVHNMYINYRLPLFERLSKRFDITFFFDEVAPTAEVSRGRFDFKLLRSILVMPSYQRTLSPALAFHLLRHKPNLFLGSGMSHFGAQVAFLLSRSMRKPYVLWEETWHWTRTTPRMVMWPFSRAMLMGAEAIIVPGLKAREFVTAAGAKPEKVFVAPNAAQASTCSQAILNAEGLKKELGIRNEKVVLYLSRLVERKGLSVLIEAFSKLQDAVGAAFLVIAGEGPFRSQAEEKCRNLAVRNVRFTGFVREEDKASYFSLADVFVLPAIRSGREVEIWGLVLNEAMCFGKPVISTPAVGGAYDLIKDEVNGYVVKEGDAGALYERLKKLLKDPDAAAKMGFQAKKTIEESFTFDLMTEGFVKAMRYAIGA
jgi:glycosyltransferase involved in cell wall biosynthesis